MTTKAGKHALMWMVAIWCICLRCETTQRCRKLHWELTDRQTDRLCEQVVQSVHSGAVFLSRNWSWWWCSFTKRIHYKILQTVSSWFGVSSRSSEVMTKWNETSVPAWRTWHERISHIDSGQETLNVWIDFLFVLFQQKLLINISGYNTSSPPPS